MNCTNNQPTKNTSRYICGGIIQLYRSGNIKQVEINSYDMQNSCHAEMASSDVFQINKMVKYNLRIENNTNVECKIE